MLLGTVICSEGCEEESNMNPALKDFISLGGKKQVSGSLRGIHINQLLRNFRRGRNVYWKEYIKEIFMDECSELNILLN